jgi:hypothetical protein
MNYDILLIGLISGFLSIFINYCIGKPSSEKFSPYEIFSGYTVYLSIRRLKKLGLYSEYEKQYNQGISLTKTKAEVINFKNDFKKMLYEAADPFFTWERAAGMCPVCNGAWLSLICGICFTYNLVFLIIIVVVSHVTIRTLNKLL